MIARRPFGRPGVPAKIRARRLRIARKKAGLCFSCAEPYKGAYRDCTDCRLAERERVRAKRILEKMP